MLTLNFVCGCIWEILDRFDALDPQKVGTLFKLTLSWIHEIEIYKSDLDTYIWRPHCKPPTPVYVHFIIGPPDGLSFRRAAMIFSTSTSLSNFKKQTSTIAPSSPDIGLPAAGLVQALHGVSAVLLDEIEDFIQEVNRQVVNVVRMKTMRLTGPS